ncbi:MAG TPA: asparagine synthase (glutamine-hydrolyzing) [Gammaproteobacteria bacterium]
MCGIAGVAARTGACVPPMDVARRMCDAIYHRGPDDEGIHYSQDVILGMRRLAIIDPAGGEQPIYNETREICAVVNGEIYNYRELQRRLEKAGHVFRSGSDVECVVHAYEEYGTECFAELRGMFAIAIWDNRNRSLVLARDRFGKKPLFYTETPRGIFFASELKSLLQVPEIDPEINQQVISDYMMLGYVPTPKSIFSEIQKLKPAHYLVFRDGRTSLHEFWTLRYTPKFDADERTLTDMLEMQVDDAVAARLTSDVPFGAFLSGGVDSSLVVAMMTRHLTEPVKTFSIGFEDSQLDESADARRVAKYLGTEHHELVVQPDAVEMLDNIAWYLDEPMADSSFIPTYLVSRLAAGHVKMVLTGDGGDEMFGGYERYVRHLQLMLMKRARIDRLAPVLELVARHTPGSIGGRIARACGRLRMSHPDDYLDAVGLGNPATVDALLNPVIGCSPGFARPPGWPSLDGESLGNLDAVISGDVRSYLLDDILVKVDRASMANSLEARAPLLDQHLAEFAARLPEHFKVRGRTTKYLLKRVACRYLPAEWVHKKKQGFAIPLSRWLRTDLAELLMDTVNSHRFASRDIFNVRVAQQLAAEHVKGARDNSATLWALLVFEMWAQRYVDGPRLSPEMTKLELRSAAGQA